MATPTGNEPGSDTDFSGLWIPLITPFHDGAIDHRAITTLVRRLQADGAKGVVVCGSTGEAAALDKSEQLQVLVTVKDAVPDLPVVMGLSGYHLPETSAWVRELGSLPVVGLLVPAPHYIRPSQAGLLRWFFTLADASSVPLIVYDIPYRTGVQLARDTLLELSRHPRIQAIKDCGGDGAKTQEMIARGDLQVLAGEDLQIFATLALGGVGAIAASAHLETAAFARLIALLRAGELTSARVLWAILLPWIEAAFAEPNPGPVKAMLAHLGEVHNELRAPMTGCSDALLGRMIRLHETHGSKTFP